MIFSKYAKSKKAILRTVIFRVSLLLTLLIIIFSWVRQHGGWLWVFVCLLILFAPLIYTTSISYRTQLNAKEALRKYSQDKSNLQALDEAIDIWLRLVVAAGFPNIKPNRYVISNWEETARLLATRSEMLGNELDLEAALLMSEQVVEASQIDSPILYKRMANLGYIFQSKYTYSNDPFDLQKSIKYYEDAIKGAPSDSRELALIYSSLGKTYHHLYSHNGSIVDLNKGIEYAEQALRIMPGDYDNEDQAGIFHDLGLLYRNLYNQTGEFSNLVKSIDLLEKAVSQLQPSPYFYVAVLSSLGNVLFYKYNHTGRLGDLYSAINIFQQAMEIAPTNHPEKSLLLNNLGNGYLQLFKQNQNMSDINKSIDMFEEAVSVMNPSNPNRSLFQGSLGIGYFTRYQFSASLPDLNRGEENLRQSLLSISEDAPVYHMLLSNLGACLLNQYDYSKSRESLDGVIATLEAALKAAPDESPARATVMNNLGEAYRRLYDYTHNGIDFTKAVNAYRVSCQLGKEKAYYAVLISSYNWGNWAIERNSWEEAVEAFTFSRHVIEQLFQIQLVRSDKESWLEKSSIFFSQLALALTQVGDLSTAAEVLEQSRARLVAETLQYTRRDLENLVSLGYGDLYNNYKNLTEKIAALNVVISEDAPNNIKELTLTKNELAETIRIIQQLPGYEDFLSLPNYEDIQSMAEEFPIVFFCITETSSFALIVTPHDTKIIWSKITSSILEKWLGDLAQQGESESSWWLAKIERFTHNLNNVLPELGEKLLKDVSEELRSMGAEEVILIPSGLLGLFPLQAATYFRENKQICFLDEFTVHYSPSVQVLRLARNYLKSKLLLTPSLAGVGNPLPHPQPLTYGQAELEEIETIFPVRAGIFYETAAKKPVFLASASSATHIHFSCHANFDPGTPLSSSLFLAGGDVLTLGEVLTNQAFGSARLITLSACQTAIVDFQRLINESIGFPAGFMQIGVPSIIGTLWGINDLSTSLLMIRFYTLHIKHNLPPARALKESQRWLRDLTNAELSKFLRSHYLDEQPVKSRGMFRIANDKFPFYTNAAGNKKPFENPRFWAGFVFYGL